jgi:hypothetical protein
MAIAAPGELPTVLDVIENHLGSRPTYEQLSLLSIPEVDELADLLRELSEAQSQDEIPGGASLLGGWLGAGSLWSEPTLRGELGKSLLYYSNLLVLDPLADYFDDGSRLAPSHSIRVRRPEDRKFNVVTSGPSIWSRHGTYLELRERPEEAVARFGQIVVNLYSLESVIRSGVVVLRNQWPTIARRSEALATSVRRDIRSKELQALARQPASAENAFAVWDHMRGGMMTFGSAALSSDEPWETQHVFYYLAKTLAIADAAGAQYVPATERDLQLLRLKAVSAAGSYRPSGFFEEVARVVVPSFEVPIREAVAIRQSSANFADWRSKLDLIRRAGAEDNAVDLKQRVQDELRPAVRSVEAELNRTSGLSLLDRAGADFLFTSGITGAAALVSGGNIPVAVGAAGVTGIVQWLRRAYGQQPTDGAQAVLAALVRGSKKP